MTLNKNELREIDIRYEIEELKKERNLTDFEDEVEAIDEKIDKLEIELLSMIDEDVQITTSQEIEEKNTIDSDINKAKAQMQHDYIYNIDMSGASDNGDR